MKLVLKSISTFIYAHLLLSCQSQIDSFLGDNYQDPIIPPFTITETLESNVLLTFTQFSIPQANSGAPAVVNSVTVNNLGSKPIDELTLLVRIFNRSSVHTYQNLQLNRKLEFSGSISVGGNHTIFLDSIYRGALTQADFEFQILSLNNKGNFASGVYSGQFKAFEDAMFHPGLTYMTVDYSGKVKIEVLTNPLSILQGVIFSSDSLFAGNAMQGNQSLDGNISGSFQNINDQALFTTLYFNTVYDSIQLYLSRE